MTRVLLFDWTVGGHHAIYLERFASALPHDLTPVVAAPSPTIDRLTDLGIESLNLGDPRPHLDTAHHLRASVVEASHHELALFRRAVETTGADYAVHMFADGILRQLIGTPPLPTKVVPLLFRPRRHYPALYDTRLSVRQSVLAIAYETVVRRWRRRPDAHVILTLDEGASQRWADGPGAPALWLPEPPVLTSASPGRLRRGATLFGGLGPRKGIHLLTNAALISGDDLRLTLAGSVTPGFQDVLASLVHRLRSHGVIVDLRTTWHNEREAIALLAEARCVVLPYVDHFGMSRVLLEAAHAGTPVVTHDHGMLGHLVTSYGIGLGVDIRSRTALRRAIDLLCHDDEVWETHHRATKHFAERYSPAHFSAVLANVFRVSPERAVATA